MGKLAIPKIHEKYETGQFFLHRVFGYRGVILFPWRSKIYDRNTYASSYTDSSAENTSVNTNEADTSAISSTVPEDAASTNSGLKQSGRSARKVEATETTDTTDADSIRNDGKKEVTVDVQTYYQVLIDSRDCPHVVNFNGFLIFFLSYKTLTLSNSLLIIAESTNRSGNFFK